MLDIWTIILYIILFVSLYVQVFFLFSFLKNKKELFTKEANTDADLLPSVSFLIPCWNEGITIKRTVDSIFQLQYPIDKLNIVIIDDGSSDNTWKVMQSFKNNPRVKILQKKNSGKYSALNLGLEHCSTELFASVDADTILDNQALVEIVKYFKNPEIVAVGGSVLIDSPSSFAQKAQSVEYQMNSYVKKMLGFTGGVLVVPGAFSVFRTDIVKQIGGYREGNNLEDLELTFRIQTKNMKVDHCHTAFAFTKGPATLGAFFKQRLRWSRGFLGNVMEYKHTIFNKNFGNFGVFSVPMGIANYFFVFFVFFWSWIYLVKYIWLKMVEINLIGFESSQIFNFLKFDFFFFDSRAIAFLIPVLYLFLVFSIFTGMRLAKSKTSLPSILSFGVIYSLLPPFWIMKSIYYTVTSKMPSWR
jgi:cellulose synthase/poly-beta-1,6-N-acetylglucosamine synthase-like glycosyltransferase